MQQVLEINKELHLSNQIQREIVHKISEEQFVLVRSTEFILYLFVMLH